MKRRVVVTGMGATTPLGGNVASTWEALLASRSGITILEDPKFAESPVRIAAPVAVDPSAVLEPHEIRKMDRSQQLALIAAREAWADAAVSDVDPTRLDLGKTLAELRTRERNHKDRNRSQQ